MGFKARRKGDQDLARQVARLGHERISRLLALEKQRIDYPPERVRFTCVSDVTKYYWCGLMSILRAREREAMLFGVYLRDRLNLAGRHGRIDSVPESDDDVLAICASFSSADPPAECWREPRESGGGWDSYNEMVEMTKMAGLKTRWSEAGFDVERYLARPLPSARWHFEWKDYIIVCEPDGIAHDYVYEFKSVKKRDWISERERRAVLQAQLGAFFFKRDAVQVELAALDKQDVLERAADAGLRDVLQVLRKFYMAESGQAEPVAPRPFKCHSCDYLRTPSCTLSPLLCMG